MAVAASDLSDGSGSAACWRGRIATAAVGGVVTAAGGGVLVWQRLLAVRWSGEWQDQRALSWPG